MKRRLLLAIVCCGALFSAVHLAGLWLTFGDVPVSGAKRTGEILSPVEMGRSERIKIEYESVGCRSWCTWLFDLSGGAEARLVVVDAGGSESVGPTPAPIGVVSLALKERRGLRDILNYYRGLQAGNASTTTNRIRVEYFRAGEKIGEEQFVDRSSVEFFIYEKNHESSPTVEARVSGVSDDMISFRDLFKRAWQEAHPPAESATAVEL